MGQKYKDSAKAAAEADKIASIAVQNLQQVLLSLRNCLHVVQKTKRMLEVDPDCICVNSNDPDSKWERRRQELHREVHSIELALEDLPRNSLDGIETILMDTDGIPEWHNNPEEVGDDNLLWCDRVCVHEKVDMDSALWCNTPQTILELVFARLPLHQIFQLRSLSKNWRASIVSPSFQNAFGTTTSRRFAILSVLQNIPSGDSYKTLWSFGISERKWYTLPIEFLPSDCDSPVAGDGGLLCCRRPALPNKSNQVKQDLQLYVGNPLTQAWRKLPLPSLVQEFDLVHMITDSQTKQYTITVVNDLQQGRQHNWNTKAVVEVYNSSTNVWTASNGIFQSTGTNLIYYKKYMRDEFVGIRAYDKSTGYTSIPPFNVPEDIFFSEARGFFPLAEYQGQIYMLQTEAATSGIWVLRGSSHEWEKICSVPKPSEILELYLFSLYVSADVIIISGCRKRHLAVAEAPDKCIWMLDGAQGKWIDLLDKAHGKWIHDMEYEWYSDSSSHIMFEIRFDGMP